MEAAAVVVIVALAAQAQADKDSREELQLRQLVLAVVAQVALVQQQADQSAVKVALV